MSDELDDRIKAFAESGNTMEYPNQTSTIDLFSKRSFSAPTFDNEDKRTGKSFLLLSSSSTFVISRYYNLEPYVLNEGLI
jgi:hypothetical protein